MPCTAADLVGKSEAELVAIRDAINLQIASLSIPTETISVTYFVHNGGDARPANIPNDVRVVYYHKDDNALVVTNSNKLKSWAKVTKYIWMTKQQFRTFAKSKSRYAI